MASQSVKTIMVDPSRSVAEGANSGRLTSLQQRLVETAGRLVRHAGYY
jgi:hypothetical protein